MEVDTIPFYVAQNFYLKNTVVSIPDPKINTEEELSKYFGYAITMGENGKPTVIDFSNEFVIAIVLPVTHYEVKINSAKLWKGIDKSIRLQYRMEKGGKQSYTSRPFLLLVVDKKYNGPLEILPLQ
jgi:hypothetical protein